MNGIELATTNELVEELSKRFPKGFLMLGLSEAPGDVRKERFYSHYHGLTACIGMVERARLGLMQEAAGGDEVKEGEVEEDDD